MYRIGQFRSPQLESYSVPLTMELNQQGSETITSGDVLFYNTCGNLSGDNVLNNQYCYYLKFRVKQTTEEQIFYLKLRNTSEMDDNEQLVEEFKVRRGSGFDDFEIIISPNATYNQILWELQRTALDYRMADSYGTGRIIEIISEYITFTRLIDVLSILKSRYENMDFLTKIGIQGPPSLLMCINREQIRIGKTGIYEINNGINITSISFVPKSSNLSYNGLDYFIMDFEY